ncbi:hypothetical protein BX600DRAFT_500746 [Xylariales sp. PMI_506]|nr:hypothetical protein BX600DRAFT_500746 [Xylariales sp. PMI_506]
MYSQQCNNSAPRHGPFGRHQNAQHRMPMVTPTVAAGAQQRAMSMPEGEAFNIAAAASHARPMQYGNAHGSLSGTMSDPLAMPDALETTRGGISEQHPPRISNFTPQESMGNEDETLLAGMAQIYDHVAGLPGNNKEILRILKQIYQQLSSIPGQLTQHNTNISQQLVQHNANISAKLTEFVGKLDQWGSKVQELAQNFPLPPSQQQDFEFNS